MESKVIKLGNVLDSEMFGNEKAQYYFDIKKARNNRYFLQITNRRQDGDKAFKRTHIILFEDDLSFFVEAITMLLGRFSQRQMGISA